MLSIRLEADDGSALPDPLPGQYLTVKIPDAGDPPPMRSYSLSGDPRRGVLPHQRQTRGPRAGQPVAAQPCQGRHRSSNPPHHEAISTSSTTTARSSWCPRASVPPPSWRWQHALATAHSPRQIWWLHTHASVTTHAFAAEVDRLARARCPNAHQRVFYTRGTEAPQRLDRRVDRRAGSADRRDGVPVRPQSFMDDMREALTAAGIDPTHIHTELFGALPPINPGVVGAPSPTRPHPPEGAPGSGTADHLRPQRTQRRLVARLPHAARIRGSVRRADPVFLPKRGVPHMRDPGDRGHDRLQPTPARRARRRHRASLHGRTAHRSRPGYLSAVTGTTVNGCSVGDWTRQRDLCWPRTTAHCCTLAGFAMAGPPASPHRSRCRRGRDVLDATARGPACPQLPSRFEWVTGPVIDGLALSEDCQVLSVTAPSDANGLPVMVWFHGGAYVSGGGEAPKYDADDLARRWSGRRRPGHLPARCPGLSQPEWRRQSRSSRSDPCAAVGARQHRRLRRRSRAG